LPKPIQSQVCDALNPKLSWFYLKDQLWILCNLTTHEYVRFEAIALKLEYILLEVCVRSGIECIELLNVLSGILIPYICTIRVLPARKIFMKKIFFKENSSL